MLHVCFVNVNENMTSLCQEYAQWKLMGMEFAASGPAEPIQCLETAPFGREIEKHSCLQKPCVPMEKGLELGT